MVTFTYVVESRSQAARQAGVQAGSKMTAQVSNPRAHGLHTRRLRPFGVLRRGWSSCLARRGAKNWNEMKDRARASLLPRAVKGEHGLLSVSEVSRVGESISCPR